MSLMTLQLIIILDTYISCGQFNIKIISNSFSPTFTVSSFSNYGHGSNVPASRDYYLKNNSCDSQVKRFPSISFLSYKQELIK